MELTKNKKIKKQKNIKLLNCRVKLIKDEENII